MSIENLVYNCGGVDYWELIYQEDYNRLCLYEGHHGKYVGEVIDNQIYNSNTGEYLGEFYENRLICHGSNSPQLCCDQNFTEQSEVGANTPQLCCGVFYKNKVGKEKIKGNFMFLPFGRMGHACIPRQPKIEIPQGYMEFTAGLS